MTSFKSPKDSLGNLSADTAATVVEAAADIALVIDSRGVIQDIGIGRIDLAPELAGVSRWAGRRFTDVVTEASQPKVEMLLNEAASGAPTQWRQLGHLDAQGGEVPVLYCAVQIHKSGRVLALGRDMRALATLQQRLVEAQMSMERDYSRLRHAETRYRVLFQTSSEPALVLDAATDRVVEANPAAARLFGETSGRMIGRNFPAGLDADSAQALQSLTTGIRAGLNVEPTRVRFTDGEEMSVATSMFRQGASAFYMLRFTPANLGTALTRDANSARLVEFSRRATDGIVVVGPEGRIQSANSAFLQMTQVMNEDQVRGELIERWLGRTGVDMNVMIANLRQHESVTLFATVMRGDFGTTTEVEISGASLGGDPPSYGLAIRNVSHRIGGDAPQTPKQLPQSVEQLKELIGRVSLKDMVRDTTDMIEKMCIQAALELTGDNRASAAEMLGLSRQSLYVKLRRYGMAEDTVDAESEAQ